MTGIGEEIQRLLERPPQGLNSGRRLSGRTRKGMKVSPWSQEEQQLLMKYHNEGLSAKEISTLIPNRAIQAIRVKLKKIKDNGGVIKITNNRPWSAEDDRLLTKMKIQLANNRAISERLGRSVSAIHGRWHKLNNTVVS